MKFLVIILLVFSFTEAKAVTCSVKIGPNQEYNADKVGQAIEGSKKLLSTRDLKLMIDTDASSDSFDFMLELEPSSQDFKGSYYIVMGVSSEKLLKKIVEPEGRGKFCNFFSTDVFTSFSYLKKTYFKTAQQLIQNLPSCEVLKELEKKALRDLKCH